MKHFVKHAVGHFDFFAMDGQLAHVGCALNGSVYSCRRPANNDPLGATALFAAASRWVREESGLGGSVPIWWSTCIRPVCRILFANETHDDDDGPSSTRCPVPCVQTGMHGPNNTRNNSHPLTAARLRRALARGGRFWHRPLLFLFSHTVRLEDSLLRVDNAELWPLELQLAVYRKMLVEMSDPSLGVEVALNWAATTGPNCLVGMCNGF